MKAKDKEKVKLKIINLESISKNIQAMRSDVHSNKLSEMRFYCHKSSICESECIYALF